MNGRRFFQVLVNPFFLVFLPTCNRYKVGGDGVTLQRKGTEGGMDGGKERGSEERKEQVFVCFGGFVLNFFLPTSLLNLGL